MVTIPSAISQRRLSSGTLFILLFLHCMLAGNAFAILAGRAGSPFEVVPGAAVWTGQVSADWGTAANWDGGTVPVSTDHVIIPETVNDPLIGNATAGRARSLFVQANAELTIGQGGSLTVVGVTIINIPQPIPASVNNLGTIKNNGLLTFKSRTESAQMCLINQAVFENNAGGEIHVDQPCANAIANLAGTFTNEGKITFGLLGYSSAAAIANLANFNNIATGDIPAYDGIYNETGAVFYNDAKISVGAADTGPASVGVENKGTFTNDLNGSLAVDHTGSAGLVNRGIFNNNAIIVIGKSASPGGEGLTNEAGAVFNNNVGASLAIDRQSASADLAIALNNKGSFNNYAKIDIGSVRRSSIGIQTAGQFKNEAAGQLSVKAIDRGIQLAGENFINRGEAAVQVESATGRTVNAPLLSQFTNAGVFKSGPGDVYGFFTSGGRIAPEFGETIFRGTSVSLDAGNTLQIKLDAARFPEMYKVSRLDLNNGDIAGNLELDINFTPPVDLQMRILSFGGNGTFETVTGLKRGWELVYTSESVELVYKAALPVNLVSFNARSAGQAAELTWRTTSETSNKGFYVERSRDAVNWSDIGFVEGNATTSQVQDYHFTDETPGKSLNYYRLRQTDFDGKTEHSRIQAVTFGNSMAELVVWADENRHAYIKTEENVEEVTVFDMSGRVLARSLQTQLDLSHAAPGILLVRVKTQHGLVTRKLFLK